MSAVGLSQGGPTARLRRSPWLLAGVAAAHGVVVLSLLQSVLTIPMTEALDKSLEVGSGIGLQVILLEAPSPLTETMAPPLEITWATAPVAPPEAPTFDVVVEDPSQDARLIGLYLGQVRARITRAWETMHQNSYPPLPDCTVRVVQSGRGEVLEVTAMDCDLKGPDRLRLFQAVRAAAPLPAPPAALPSQTTLELQLTAAP